MRPDTYKQRAANSWDPYVEEGGNQNNNNFSFKDNALGIVALIFAALALGAVIMQAIKDPQILDAKIQAGIAGANATSHAADTNARVALDKVEDVRTSLKAANIKIADGH